MEPTELILLEGTVSAVIYRNEENGYTILRLESDQEEDQQQHLLPFSYHVLTRSDLLLLPGSSFLPEP